MGYSSHYEKRERMASNITNTINNIHKKMSTMAYT